MIGIDIVDLEFSKRNSRWQEQRFLDKLFSAQEQDFILSDGKRFENIWRLWSMKESAYKVTFRADGIHRFNPKDFKCFVTDATQGKVRFGTIVTSAETEIHPDYIKTTAFLKPNWTSDVVKLSHSDSGTQHKQSYQHAIKAYASLKTVSQNTVEIVKNKLGVPQFYINGNLQYEQVSLSHHGYFGAIAIAV